MNSLTNKLIFTLLGLLTFKYAESAPGDTTSIMVHDHVDITWYGNYDRQAIFPDGSMNYRKILMTYTLGCASGGCSDWDYTTQIHFRRHTGQMDSTINSIDTLSTIPLVIDTTWNVFEIIENMELGRVITPYGGYMANSSNGFTNAWEHRHYFDVTDYMHLLKDTCQIRAHYSGWSSGFSVTLRFDFIEGDPPRDVLGIQNIYKGSKSYSSSANFESTYFTAKNVDIPANTTGARIYSTITGHGFDNNVNCAEFCPRQYDVIANGNTIGNATIWKDDCGLNPIYPQGGTWIYDRAGWCPGSKCDIHEFEWNGFNAGQSNTIDFNLQNYTWTGSQTPSYTVDAHVVYYGNNNYTNDASLLEIIAPSNHEEHGRMNPFCGRPKIKVKNLGAADLSNMIINYGLDGASTCTYNWTGSISFLEEVNIELPNLDWNGMNTTSPSFWVEIASVNSMTDDYPQDNMMRSSFEMPELLAQPYLILGVRTNNNPQETSYRVIDDAGNIVFQRNSNMVANTLYKDSIYLNDGCYEIIVEDFGGDGLGWWANTAQGSGSVGIYSTLFSWVTLKSFNIDFGSQLRYPFVLNTLDSTTAACNLLTSTEKSLEDSFDIEVYPNPATDQLNLKLNYPLSESSEITILNASGLCLMQEKSNNRSSIPLNVAHLSSGIYLIVVKDQLGNVRTKNISILR